MPARFSGARCRKPPGSVARQGYSRIVVLLLADVAAWLLLSGALRVLLGGALLILLLLVINFYRDPERQGPPSGGGAVLLSPADGRVVTVQPFADGLRISIFLSAFDVHVNRAPVSGRIVDMVHSPGRFLPAFLERSSTENERVTMRIDCSDGGRVVCTQVAGLLARRIENWVEPGQTVAQGQRYGMIHLGSRIDLEAPGHYRAVVKPGQHVRAGTSVLAERHG
jgi:phosphatidylserine decarboxylase